MTAATSHTHTAIVTGAASGIGAATVALLVERGYRIACVDRDGAGLRAMMADIGASHVAFQIDVTDEAEVTRVFAEAAAALGGLDALVTSAGVAEMTPFMELDAATFRRVYDDNVVGTFLCIREAARHMVAGGRICTVASVAGLRGGGLSGTAAYAASKGAVLALTKSAARSLAGKGIAVNTIAPGATLTPMIAHVFADEAHRQRVESMSVMNRAAEPAEIARAIAFLISADAAYVDGATLVADGGLCMY
ncbi:MAG: SDR family NAD(P)-dependent oxidoreductase [Casimicrobiaceae bacterium]